MTTKTYSAQQIASLLNAEYNGPDTLVFTGVNGIDAACGTELTFASPEYFSRLTRCKAGAVILNAETDKWNGPAFIVKNVDEALIKALEAFADEPQFSAGIEPTAVISAEAQVHESAYIGDFVVLRGPVTISEGAIIKSGAKLEGPCEIGRGTIIDSNCVIYPRTKIGAGCVIKAGSVIGSAGFGFRAVNNLPTLIPHNGGVVIEDYVSIGANCCVDRAKFGNTIIGTGTKIDNLCQIAHNVRIGKCTLIAAQNGFAGSAVIGDGCMFGGQSAVTDHLTVGNMVKVGGKSVITKNTPDGSVILGVPGRDRSKYVKEMIALRRLPEMAMRLMNIEKRLDADEAEND
jgi:UDP-3-O-[3-hydroxymyristoyl] glucosamine N-acyltransferase